jgi:sugar lactone lactonase YvrE
MNTHLPCIAPVPKVLRTLPLLLGGVLLCIVPIAASAQSVTFAGTQEVTLPFTGLSGATGVAVDKAGDVFLVNGNSVVELPKTATGYGAQTTLPFSGLDSPLFVALDSAGDVFVPDTDNNRVLELPKTSMGYGAQTTLPTNGLIHPQGIAVDGTGNVFVADTGNERVVELPQTTTGYGPQTTVVGDLPHPRGIAADSAGDLFITIGNLVVASSNYSVVELPRTGTGYGAQTTLPFTDLYVPEGVAVDSAGDVFVADNGCANALCPTNNAPVFELPRTGTGYGPQITVQSFTLTAPFGAAVDSAGDVLATDSYNKHVQEVQVQTPVNFSSAYVCVSGQTDPAPCSQSLSLNYNITVSGTLGAPQVLTGGAPNLDFTLAKGSGCSGAVTEGSTCTVNVAFTPTTPGTRNGTVEITNESGTVIATTTIFGTGIEPPPVPKVSTTYLGFGTIPVDDTNTLSLTVTNAGGGTLTVAPVITGYSSPPPSAFPYAITSDTCGAGLTFGEGCTLQVQFAPTTAGTHDDLLTLQTNGTANPAINLVGIAIAGGIVVSGAPLEFGTVPYGSSAVLPLTITDYGLPGTVTVNTVLNSSSFKVLTTAQNTCQAGVTAGHSCVLPVQFAPDSVGAHNALLTLTASSGGASLTAALHGSGSGLGVNTSVLKFGNVATGSSVVESLTITNVGLGLVRVKTAVSNPNYTVLTTTQNTCQGLRPEGHSCTLPVEFSPTSPGYQYGTLTLTPNDGVAPTIVGLEGTGAALTGSVTFAGAPTTLGPTNTGVIGAPDGMALDSAENVFIASPGNVRFFSSCCGYEVVELPGAALGYGPLANMPAWPFSGSMAVDSANDVFIADPFYSVVVELPRTGTSYDSQTILPFDGLNGPNGVAVDGEGDVFVSDAGNARVVELPREGTGYGSQTTVPTGGLYGSIAADGPGDLFIATATGVVELPREGTGYGPPATLPFSGLNSPNAIAVDSAGDVFAGNGGNQIWELPRAGNGYGTQVIFFDPPQGGYHSSGAAEVAVNAAGDNLFIANQVVQSEGNFFPPYTTYYGNVVEVQTHSVNFGTLCAAGQTPCSTTLPLSFSVNDNVMLGTPVVLTGGAPTLDFTLASGSTCTGAVTPGTFCSVNVTFSPQALGTRSGTVEIVNSAGTVLATTPVHGVGTGQPVAQVSTNTLQFGQIGSGATETLPLTVTNAGQGTLIVLPSINAPNYTIAGNTCAAGVTAGKSCTLELEFSPAAIGANNGTLTLQNNGSTTPSVALDGVANGLSVSVSPLQFGANPVGFSQVLPLTVTNIGLPGKVTVATTTGDPSYTVLTTAQNTCLAGIAAGNSCNLPVQFTPNSVGEHISSLTLTASAQGAITTVGLDGAGVTGVAFTGATGTLPFTGLSSNLGGIGVDAAGDVILYDGTNGVLELPRTTTGYGSQATLLPISYGGLTGYLAVDIRGNVYLSDVNNPDGNQDGEIVVIPRTGTGYGGPNAYSIYNEDLASIGGGETAVPAGIAVDSKEDIFTTDTFNAFSVLEFPAGGTNSPIGLGPGSGIFYALAVDGAGNLFAQIGGLWETPLTAYGYGNSIALPAGGQWVAADSTGNVYVSSPFMELPNTATGFGAPIKLLPGNFGADAVDSAGNVYITQGNNVLQLQRSSPNFGTVNVCAPTPCGHTLTFNYSVNSEVTFGAPKILTGGKPNLDFTLAGGSTCTGTVTAGSFCTVNVTFAPLAGGIRNGTVEIIDSDGNVRVSTPVSGLGVAPTGPPTPLLSTTLLQFGAIDPGTTETLPLTVTNNGGGTLTVSPSIDGPSYLIAASTCGGGVTAGKSCTLQVEFSPTSVGPHNQSMTLVTNAATNPQVVLDGIGSGLSVSGAPLQFGTLVYGSTEVLPLTITNLGLPGTVKVATTSNDPSYTVLTTAQNTCVAGITAGQSCVLPVQFSPDSVGSHDATLALTPIPSSGAPATLAGLEGSAVALVQSVSFGSAQSVLPAIGLWGPYGIAMDSSGDVIIADWYNDRTVVLPKASTGYAPQVNLPAGGQPIGVGVDSAGDVFYVNVGRTRAFEYARTPTGYKFQPGGLFMGLVYPTGLAVDSAGDIFVSDEGNKDVLELPKTSTGYGPQMILPLGAGNGIAVDSTKNVYIAGNPVVELPWTSTGYGSPTTLPFSVLGNPYGIAVDSAGDVFVADLGNNRVVELPKTSTGYGSQSTLPINGLNIPLGVAVNSSGDVFVGDFNNNRVLEVQSKTPVNFGSSYVCAPGSTTPVPCSQTLTLNFNVNFDVTLGTPKVLNGGTPDLDFTLASGSTCSGAVAAGTTCTVNVTFAPLAVGTRSGTVEMEISNASGTVIATTPISGLGVAAAGAPPVAQVSTTALQFGTVGSGNTETLPLTVENIGGGTLTIAPSINAQSYTIAGSTCGGGLTTGQSCTLQVEFAPTSAATDDNLLTLHANGLANPTVNLDGVGIAVPAGTPIATVSPTYLSFGTVPFGTTSTQSITVTNSGGGLLTVAPPSITGQSYTNAGNNCAGEFPQGTGCTLQVQFSPTSIATHDNVLTVQSNGGNPTVNLAGKVIGLSVLGGVSGGKLQFGSVASGSTEVETLTVTNVGLPGTVTVGTAITVGTTATPTTTYTILTTSQNTCLAGIATGQNCTLPIEFAPTSSGTHDDLLTLTPGAGGGSTTVWLFGSTP